MIGYYTQKPYGPQNYGFYCPNAKDPVYQQSTYNTGCYESTRYKALVPELKPAKDEPEEFKAADYEYKGSGPAYGYEMDGGECKMEGGADRIVDEGAHKMEGGADRIEDEGKMDGGAHKMEAKPNVGYGKPRRGIKHGLMKGEMSRGIKYGQGREEIPGGKLKRRLLKKYSAQSKLKKMIMNKSGRGLKLAGQGSKLFSVLNKL